MESKSPAQPTQDMTAPLSHYFIYGSHNTYLTGNQLTSEAGTFFIKKALLDGCRVIELDCWPDKKSSHKIIVFHGHTLTKPVAFEDCLKVIKDHAFVSSEYPVIITIENHIDEDLQRKAAEVIMKAFGELLFIPSPEERAAATVRQFASPEELKGKIIISDAPPKDAMHTQIIDEFFLQLAFLKYSRASHRAKKYVPPACVDELKELIYIYSEKLDEMEESSDEKLIAPKHRSIMANLSEPQLRKLAQEQPTSLIKFSTANLGRMYPIGLRITSSNPDPYLAWSYGFQVAALNIQTQDTAYWVAKALFNVNGKCGYVKKPSVFLDGKSFAEIQKMSPKLVLKMSVLMGGGLWPNRHSFYVKVELDGIPSDKARYRTDLVHNKKPQLFEFPIRLPEIAVLRLELWQHTKLLPFMNDFVGQACIAVALMENGEREIQLQSKSGDALQYELKCCIQMEDMRNSS